MNTDLTQTLRAFAETVSLNKGRAYFVGGYVRDGILGIESKDIDIEVHGVEPKALRTIVESHFKDVEEQGEAFGVLKVHYKSPVATSSDEGGSYEIDISLPRTDSKVAPGHTGFAIHVDPDMGIEAAAQRRDFTINAMLQDILSGEVFDPYGGQTDLEARVLRAVDVELFGDDPLRVLRGVQFAARFGLTVAPDTQALMASMVDSLQELFGDRKRVEWRKLFLKAPKPSVGLALAHQLGIFTGALDVFAQMARTEQDPIWHPEGSVWAHTIWGADEVVALCEREGLSDDERLLLQLANLLHDAGKVDSTVETDGRVHSKGHQESGQRYVRPVLRAFGMERFEQGVAVGMRYHHHPMWWFEHQDKVEDGHVIGLARQVAPMTLRMLSYITEVDLRSRGPYPDYLEGVRRPEIASWFRAQAERLSVLDGPPPDVIRGHDLLRLGWKPGPAFGMWVRAANTLHDEDGVGREVILKRLEACGQDVSSEQEALDQLRVAKNSG